MSRLEIAIVSICSLSLSPTTHAAETPIPVAVEAEVDATETANTGLFELHLWFEPEQDIDVSLLVKVVVSNGRTLLFERDHAPPKPTRQWRDGKREEYQLSVPFPILNGVAGGTELDLRIGFVDVATNKTHPPEGYSYSPGVVTVATFLAPDYQAVETEERADKLIEKAKELARDGHHVTAWDVLELGIRLAPEDVIKERMRVPLLKVGTHPPRPMSLLEEGLVKQRIEEEKERYFRLVAGRLFDRQQYYGALALMTEVGGTLEEQAGAAVIGAVDDAQRLSNDLEDVKAKLLDHLTDDERNEVERLTKSLGLTRALLDKADSFFNRKQYAAARRLYRDLRLSDTTSVKERAYAQIAPTEELLLAAIPADQQAAVDEALKHPSWARTVSLPSHRFIFIGPKKLIEGIPAESKLRFDLAYIFLTDLFGRVPNPGGDRVIVYYKELWDFGGGEGGGTNIRIGRADPERRDVTVDNGLLYHELTHCIDETEPIFDGFREGLANVGAAYAFEALDQKGDGQHSFRTNLDAFRADYLGRDLEYWRIQEYGPSAGFFLHFVDKYARRGEKHDWRPLRQFFREYRDAPIRDGREPYIARALAWYLMRAFGDGVFDDLMAFRFPLRPEDRSILEQEIEAFVGAGMSQFEQDGAATKFPNSPLPRDRLGRRLIQIAQSDDFDDAREFGEKQLGLIYDWKVIGPFSEAGSDPDAAVFPPEYEIDFEKRYTVKNNIANWRDPQSYPPVVLEPTGWTRIEYSYQDNTATYALSHVTVPRDVAAIAHIRADDNLTLFVNDERVSAYVGRGRNSSSRISWRGPHYNSADGIKLDVVLHKGRNKILLKVRNKYGNAGFALALSARDGAAIEGLVADANLPDSRATVTTPKWTRRLSHNFKSKSFAAKLDTTVGTFKVDKKRLVGTSTDKKVAWRKYTVRPGFPKDSPSNLAWLRGKTVTGIDDFQLRFRLHPNNDRSRKFLVTFQGEGNDDGLSGWTLIVLPKGKGGIEARIERYDQLIYHSGVVKIPDLDEKAAEKGEELTITLLDNRCSVTWNDVPLFVSVWIRPIPNRDRIGFATWGPSIMIDEFELLAPPEK